MVSGGSAGTKISAEVQGPNLQVPGSKVRSHERTLGLSPAECAAFVKDREEDHWVEAADEAMENKQRGE